MSPSPSSSRPGTGGAGCRGCFGVARARRRMQPAEVIVVDNGSTDATLAWLAREAPRRAGARAGAQHGLRGRGEPRAARGCAARRPSRSSTPTSCSRRTGSSSWPRGWRPSPSCASVACKMVRLGDPDGALRLRRRAAPRRRLRAARPRAPRRRALGRRPARSSPRARARRCTGARRVRDGRRLRRAVLQPTSRTSTSALRLQLCWLALRLRAARGRAACGRRVVRPAVHARRVLDRAQHGAAAEQALARALAAARRLPPARRGSTTRRRQGG